MSIFTIIGILKNSFVLHVLASNDYDVVVIGRQCFFSLIGVDDVVSTQTMEDVGPGQIHRVIVVPQVARRLHIFIPVHLHVYLVFSWSHCEAGCCWISEQIVL